MTMDGHILMRYCLPSWPRLFYDCSLNQKLLCTPFLLLAWALHITISLYQIWFLHCAKVRGRDDLDR